MYVCVTLFKMCVSCHIRSLYVCVCCTLFRMLVSCRVMSLYVCLCQSVFGMHIGCYTRSFPVTLHFLYNLTRHSLYQGKASEML